MSLLQSLHVVKPGRRSYTPALDASFAADRSLVPRVGYPWTLTRASEGRYFNSAAVLQAAAINAARFDHNPSTLASLGLRLEEQRTNYVHYSEAPAGLTGWATYNDAGAPAPTLTPNYAAAPNGTTTALRLQADMTAASAGEESRVQLTTLVLPDTSQIAASYWLKSNTGSNQTVKITNRGGAESIFVTVTPNWQRFSPAATTPSSTVQSSLRIGARKGQTDDPLDILIWGAQLEQSAYVTTYIPTAGSTVTRSADIASINGSNFTSLYHPSQGTVIAEGVMEDASFPAFFNFYYNASTDFFGHYRTIGSHFTFRMGNGASIGLYDNVTGYVPGQPAKIALAWNGSTFTAALNGVATNGTTAVGAIATPFGLTLMRRQNTAGGTVAGSQGTGYLSRVRYYRERLPDAKLVELTTL